MQQDDLFTHSIEASAGCYDLNLISAQTALERLDEWKYEMMEKFDESLLMEDIELPEEQNDN